MLMQHVRGGRVLYAVPARVVEHTDERLVTWTAPGTIHAYPVARGGGRHLRPLDEWHPELRTWYGNGNLDVTRFGDAWMIRHVWHDDGSFRGWYVNFQAPLRATPLGFDCDDHQLDLWIESDGSVTWKDEDDLERAAELDMLEGTSLAGVRAEAERILAEWPFPTGWEDFRPDPLWELPELPAGWHEL